MGLNKCNKKAQPNKQPNTNFKKQNQRVAAVCARVAV